MTRRQVPSGWQIEEAAGWLRCNEGDEGEAESCHLVADWIISLGEARDIRQIAKQKGFTTRYVRQVLKTKEG